MSRVLLLWSQPCCPLTVPAAKSSKPQPFVSAWATPVSAAMTASARTAMRAVRYMDSPRNALSVSGSPPARRAGHCTGRAHGRRPGRPLRNEHDLADVAPLGEQAVGLRGAV